MTTQAFLYGDESLKVVTGWPAGMLQDQSRKLSKWLANRIDSRLHAREAVAAISAATSHQGEDE